MEKQQEELREMMLALEKDKKMEASERQNLEEQISEKAQEIEQIRVTVEKKEQEAIRLQEEMNEANLQLQVKMFIYIETNHMLRIGVKIKV